MWSYKVCHDLAISDKYEFMKYMLNDECRKQAQLRFAEFVVICTIGLVWFKSNSQIPFERI